MQNLSKKQKELYKAISKILWEKWDPIGVYNEDDEWDDEYDSYVPHIFRLAVEGKDAVRIAQSLSLSVKNDIGLNEDKAHDLKIANLIVQAKINILG
ncbi:MAG: hypothetical protein HWE27_14250 [Gammaproteobacteria bacterium]|nr:hypothetical protein [Gammaproteobacteria bacterium]